MNDETNPLEKFEWNEAEGSAELYRGILVIVAFDRSGMPQAVGSGFVIKSEGREAWAMTAAHVIAEIRRLQAGRPRHSPSTPDIFLPKQKPIDLSHRKLWVASRNGDSVQVLNIVGVILNEDTDIALLKLRAQDVDKSNISQYEFALDDSIPAVGTPVCVLSLGNLGTQDFSKDGDRSEFKLSLRPVLRVGRVTAYHPDGTRLCRGPCIETSIPVFSGMSGGPVFLWNGGIGALKPFALVCSDPDLDGEQKFDKEKAGASIMALLPTEAYTQPDGSQYAQVKIVTDDFSGELDPGNVIPSYRPKGNIYLLRYQWWRFRLPL